jgi:hypothetical protein
VEAATQSGWTMRGSSKMTGGGAGRQELAVWQDATQQPSKIDDRPDWTNKFREFVSLPAQWQEERQRRQRHNLSGQTTQCSGKMTGRGTGRQEVAAWRDAAQQTARMDERQPHQRMRGAHWGARVKSGGGRDDHC